jgi:hyaluronan synthase
MDNSPQSVRSSWSRVALNTLACIFAVVFVFGRLRSFYSYAPITIGSILEISLAEWNRRKSIQRVRKLEGDFGIVDQEKYPEGKPPVVDCLASVVGYREESALFEKCLKSYYGTPGLKIMVVGVDGNESKDLEMVQVVQKVREIPELVIKSLDLIL